MSMMVSITRYPNQVVVIFVVILGRLYLRTPFITNLILSCNESVVNTFHQALT